MESTLRNGTFNVLCGRQWIITGTKVAMRWLGEILKILGPCWKQIAANRKAWKMVTKIYSL